MSQAVLRIKPNHYIHVLDNNTNVARVEVGPRTFTRQDHEQVIFGPQPMVMIPPRHYVIIANPVVRDEDGNVQFIGNNQAKLKHGDSEIRFAQEPFPLYPGEKLESGSRPSALVVVQADQALRLRCLRDFEADGESRNAGDEWLFKGPATYIPRIEVEVVELTRGIVVEENKALKLRARNDCVDVDGVKRKAGEEWLHRSTGSFLPGVEEEVIGTIEAKVLTPNKALHLRATRTFKDAFGKSRKAGDEWLVTLQDSETHLPDVSEQLVGVVEITTLTNRQFCIVLDPVDSKTGHNVLGRRELRVGEVSFFLQPGERLESGIQDIYILSEEEALLLRARADFKDADGNDRSAGDKWMIRGPCDFIPVTDVEVLERRRSIPLDENEGIYVRDIKTGKVTSVIGKTYMLEPHEELWEKHTSPEVEKLLKQSASRDRKSTSDFGDRDRSRVITYRVPHGAAVQIYDFKQKASRVVFGPDLVMLGADEEFTVMDLSGDIPKKPSQIQSLALFLGPDFMTDQIVVETSDHARLSLKLAYNWHFEVDEKNPETIFATSDFVGDLCKALGSLVRGAVASSSFDEFHKSSSDIIQKAVFGNDEEGEVQNRLKFNANNLVITNIDVQSVEPIDQRTRDALQKSVQLAIEITTKSQESSARHEAERMEQEAKGYLERQKIEDEAEAEKARKNLLQLQSQSAAVSSTGQATAEAKARADAALIEGEAEVTQSQLRANAAKIEFESDLETLINKQNSEIEHQRSLNELELKRAKDLANIESEKFANIVEAIGADTIKSIANAGPEMQQKLLNGLGLKSFMITDGNSPINLFNTASGLVSQNNE